jgi:hypothetical protein
MNSAQIRITTRSHAGHDHMYGKNRKGHNLLQVMAFCFMEIRGLEPSSTPSNLPKNEAISGQATQNPTYRLPNDLQEIVSAWPEMGCALKAAVLAVVRSRKAER